MHNVSYHTELYKVFFMYHIIEVDLFLSFTDGRASISSFNETLEFIVFLFVSLGLKFHSVTKLVDVWGLERANLRVT